MRLALLSGSLLLWTLLVTPSADAQVEIDIETGAALTGYNNVRIPGDTGTRFSLSEDLAADTEIYYRLRVFYDFGRGHHLGALYAPLTIESSGRLDRAVAFAGETYPANTPLSASYRFDSYRLVYRYDLLRRERFELGLGFTAKIRDARIALEGAGRSSEKTNVGFVPIVHFRALWRLSEDLAFRVDGDALAAPQGRAEDVLAALSFDLSDSVSIKAGYRLLEGGSDNDEVYTFALIHYASVGAIVRL